MPYSNSLRARLFVLSALCASLAHADNIQTRTCETWNTARKANLSTAVQREWLFGYVNGWRDAQLAQTGQDLFQAMPSLEVLIEKTNVFCENSPTALVTQSLTVLIKP